MAGRPNRRKPLRPPADRPAPSTSGPAGKALGTPAVAGFQFGAVLLVFTGLGYWLDGLLGTLPLLTLVGAAVGGVGGFLHLYRSLTRPRQDGGSPS